jgi:hypothetical protein
MPHPVHCAEQHSNSVSITASFRHFRKIAKSDYELLHDCPLRPFVRKEQRGYQWTDFHQI